MNKKYYVPFFVVLSLILGMWTYTRAVGSQITVCVKKGGLVYVIGKEFGRTDCKKSDSLLSWNSEGIQGPKGDKGDKGDTGEQGPTGLTGPKGDNGRPAQLGAGNIAFMPQIDLVITTDGNIWQWSNGWFIDPSAPKVPISVLDIVYFEGYRFIDSNGDVWRLSNNKWVNVGHP